MKTFIIKLLFTACLTALSGPIWSQSSGAFTANRTTGVAPLSVYFDASGAFGTEEGAFHNYEYRWDFGDGPNALWATSGKVKNEAFGPVAAHVFEQPGTYQVTLSVHNSSGQVLTDLVTITVTDPDVVFTGTATKCISSNGDFTGCPTGSQQLTLSNFSNISTHLGNNTRILLRRGETWDVNSTLVIQNVENVTFGAFGTGESPRLVANESRSVISFMSGRQNTNWRILDMDMESPGDVSRSPAIYPGDQLLLKNVEIEGFVGMVQGGRVGSDKKENLFIVDSYLHDIRGALDLGALGNAVYMGGHAMAIMGTTIDNTERGEHVIRITETTGTVVSHNAFSNPGFGRHVIKLHARCLTNLNGEPCAPSREYTENIVISDNQISGRLNDWDVVIGPQSKDYDEAVRKVLVERNYFTHPSSVNKTSVVVCSSDITIRNNVFQNFGASHTAAYVFRRGIEAIPNNVYLYNNTMVNGTGSARLAGVDQGTNVHIRNNLVVGTSATELTVLSGISAGSVNSSHNLMITDFGIFQGGSTFPFNLADGGAPVDAGTAVPVVSDYNRQPRPMGSGYDIGAYESGSTGNTGDTTPPSAPSNVQVTNVSTTSLDLSWSASLDNIGVAYYQIELTTGSVVTDVVTATGTSVTLTGLTPGTQYQLSITAFDAAGNQSAAGLAAATTGEDGTNDTIPPSVPANLTAANITESSVTLSWDLATDNDVVDRYELFQDGTSTPVVTVLATNPASTEITGLTAATAYSFTVRAVDASDNASALSAPVAVTTAGPSGPDTELPATPINLQVTGVTSGTVSLFWDPSTDNVGVMGYNVYQKDVPAPVATVTGTSAVVSGLSPSTFYKFKVAALDQAGNESLWSSAVDAITLEAEDPGDTIPPSTPGNERVVNIDYTSMDVLWDPSTDDVGIAYYQIIMIDATEASDTVDVLTTTTTSLSLTGLTIGRFYQYWLTAFDAAGNQSLSTFAGAFAIDAISPTVPQNLVAIDVTESSVTLSWDPATDNNVVSHYEIFQNDDFIPLVTVFAESGPQVVITGLDPSTNYRFAIRARDGEGNGSALSAPVVVTTADLPADTIPPTVPSYINAANVDFTSLDLSWSASTDNVGVAYYQIELIDETEGPYDTLGVITTTDTAIFLTDLFDGTFYQLRVTAFDEAGNQSDGGWTVAFTTDQIQPTVPTNLTASNITESSVKLSWDHATDNWGMDLYEIFQDGAPSPVATVYFPDSTAVITGLTSASTYNFTIRAVDWNGNASALTGTLVVTTASLSTPDTEQPTTPTNFQVTGVTSGSVSLAWGPSVDNVGVTGYHVYQWNVSGPVATVTGTSAVVSGLSPSTYYKFKVTALDQAGNESWQTSAVDATTASASARQSGDAEMNGEDVVVSVYPNPATSIIHLVTDHQPDETLVIKMTDLSGKEINRWSSQGNKHRLDVSGYGRGIYFIRISGDEALQEKIILK